MQTRACVSEALQKISANKGAIKLDSAMSSSNNNKAVNE